MLNSDEDGLVLVVILVPSEKKFHIEPKYR